MIVFFHFLAVNCKLSIILFSCWQLSRANVWYRWIFVRQAFEIQGGYLQGLFLGAAGAGLLGLSIALRLNTSQSKNVALGFLLENIQILLTKYSV